MSDNGSPAPRRPVTLETLLLVALVGAVIGVYVQMGSVRVEMVERVSTVERRLLEEFAKINERLAALEAKIDIQRAPAQSGNGGP
ncbi:MAG: hypothetical protein OXN97_06705 [Bryobacterales bacterium]|nr:hypothetical protein [Bryobacterales bacterium]MDE3262367.1 hypothetical protein [Acidobacteriota bacterium]MXZ60013.1 hypothetical protein [Acidobacteriota bacterium]MYE92910.1 hypothetical protein [Gemmatimonadota bacterium]MYJ12279.1 hypothetical protein [Gemmatimonadota bacterium]